ncbi:hypothetical protein T440DRAFT_400893 [Plenodomus tracheiphilus IPT5]|uniref:Alpha/beta-hydrolase n=1 Tax=Plenodomus tracheiphilus IPT5 TaxID=1408161 RepID=A0A6A7AZN4_9PLEO|nr:hypothetical protein T440DRAFT_400893 [Plenodomus tracheiphilus IPT5]
MKGLFVIAIALRVSAFPAPSSYAKRFTDSNVEVKLTFASGLLDSPTDGRVVLMFAPNGTNPLEDTGVTSSPNKIYGRNVYKVNAKSTITFSGGSNSSTSTGVYGWPDVSMSKIPAGVYQVQAFLNKYETVTRSDGSKVSVHFPCGDGAPNVNTFGSLITTATDIEISGNLQTIELLFNNVTETTQFTGNEVGGCNQGSYADVDDMTYVKVRSEKLSTFWGRNMYIGANVVLPAGYDPKDTSTRYPVIYSQGHWAGGAGAFDYGRDVNFSTAWNQGNYTVAGTKTTLPTPKLILVTFRHEAPFYDDSYAVNTANLGPYGDAINDELVPHIDATFNTIRAPYARIQEGGSTGGWESIASLIYRPDLFGACFSSYPDSLDFHRHQDIELYTANNAYRRADGSFVPSIREFVDGKEVILATVANENHWEFTFGTASRSSSKTGQCYRSSTRCSSPECNPT